jgi:hypothetical protein
MTEELVKKVNYNPNGGVCCATCRNDTTKNVSYGCHLTAHGVNKVRWCYTIEDIPKDGGCCDEYFPK